MTLNGAKFSPHFSPDGSMLACALDLDGSESYHIVIHDFKTNTTTDLTPQIVYAHQPNITWSPDGQWIAVESESTASDRSIHVVPVGRRKGTKPKTVQLMVEGKALNAQHPTWSPDSKLLAFSCENGEWHNIGMFNVETQEIIWLTDSVGDDTQPAWSRSGEIVGWVHGEGARTSFQSCTEPRRSVKKRGGELRQVKVGDGVHAHPQIMSEGVVIVYGDVNHPPDLWKINLDSGEALQLTKSLDEEVNFIQPDEIWIGDVPALLYRAESKRAVIDIHGGPNWHLQFSWNPALSYMVARGWTVLAPNYRSSMGYGRMWQNASRYDMGGVELGLSSAGTVQLGHYYGFSVNVYGFSTNAHTLDAQNAFERGLNATIPVLAGADELSGIGEMEAGVMGSYTQMVLDNELIGSVMRLRTGLSADVEHLAVEIISNEMDGTRNYLGQKHTLKHLRAGELALTKLAERNSWETWEDKGRKQMVDHAIEEAERILREHQVPPLEQQQEKELDKIMAAAEAEMVRRR